MVAIGSSSTTGSGASAADRSFPTVMQQRLSGRGAVIYDVTNKGLNGDTLAGMQARLQRDVLDLRPQVVILQTGVNDAINGQGAAALAGFTDRFRAVVSALKAQTAVVVMNGQHYPSEPAIYLVYHTAM